MWQKQKHMNHFGFQSHRLFPRQAVALSLISLLLSLMLVFSWTPKAWSDELKRDIVLMVDNSGSMKKNDPEFLAYAALKAFVSENDDATRVALIVFDQEVNLPVPFTSLTGEAKPALLEAIQKIDYSGSLTNSPAALERAIYELALHGREEAEKSIIFITDGVVDTGNQAQDKRKENWMLEELSGLASESNIRIFSIAFAEAANYQLLQTLAFKTKGDYFRVFLADDLPRVFTRLREINRPTSALLTENVQPLKETPSMRAPGDSMRESLNVVKTDADLLTKETTVLNEPIAAKAPLNDAESMVPSESNESNRLPSGLTNETRRRDVDKGLILVSALLISLMAFSAFLIIRKGSSRLSRLSAEHSPPANDYQPKAFLLDINHHTSKRKHSLSKRITMIGRVNSAKHSPGIDHLLISKPTVGREHAAIEFKDDGYWLVDQGSINGTLVDGKRVREKVRLKDGNRVCFHDVEFVFSVPELNKYEKTLIVPAPNVQEKTVFDENVIFTNSATQECSPQASSNTKVDIDRPSSNTQSQERSQDKSRFNAQQENTEPMPSVNNSVRGKPAIPEAPMGSSTSQ
jgi:pSer/pThr/pTyr-binding forkhead associated (FHA) protein